MPAIPIPSGKQRVTTGYRLISFAVGPIPLVNVPAQGGNAAIPAETRRVTYGVQPVDADGLPLGEGFAVRISDLAARITGYATDATLGANAVAYAQAAAAKSAVIEAALSWHMQLELALQGKAELPPL